MTVWLLEMEIRVTAEEEELPVLEQRLRDSVADLDVKPRFRTVVGWMADLVDQDPLPFTETFAADSALPFSKRPGKGLGRGPST